VSRSPRRWLALGAISLLALGCGAQLATPGGEARAGAAAAAEIEQAVGLVDAPALASYVDESGTISSTASSCSTWPIPTRSPFPEERSTSRGVCSRC
jgi:hypothetical protein